jgi:hypothetical protein
MNIYVSIGNSDDRLTQREWHDLILAVDAVCMSADEIHGAFFSAVTAPFQNACWCIRTTPAGARSLKSQLAALARQFRQDAIAWAPVSRTEMLGSAPHAAQFPLRSVPGDHRAGGTDPRR